MRSLVNFCRLVLITAIGIVNLLPPLKIANGQANPAPPSPSKPDAGTPGVRRTVEGNQLGNPAGGNPSGNNPRSGNPSGSQDRTPDAQQNNDDRENRAGTQSGRGKQPTSGTPGNPGQAPQPQPQPQPQPGPPAERQPVGGSQQETPSRREDPAADSQGDSTDRQSNDRQGRIRPIKQGQVSGDGIQSGGTPNEPAQVPPGGGGQSANKQVPDLNQPNSDRVSNQLQPGAPVENQPRTEDRGSAKQEKVPETAPVREANGPDTSANQRRTNEQDQGQASGRGNVQVPQGAAGQSDGKLVSETGNQPIRDGQDNNKQGNQGGNEPGDDEQGGRGQSKQSEEPAIGETARAPQGEIKRGDTGRDPDSAGQVPQTRDEQRASETRDNPGTGGRGDNRRDKEEVSQHGPDDQEDGNRVRPSEIREGSAVQRGNSAANQPDNDVRRDNTLSENGQRGGGRGGLEESQQGSDRERENMPDNTPDQAQEEPSRIIEFNSQPRVDEERENVRVTLFGNEPGRDVLRAGVSNTLLESQRGGNDRENQMEERIRAGSSNRDTNMPVAQRVTRPGEDGRGGRDRPPDSGTRVRQSSRPAGRSRPSTPVQSHASIPGLNLCDLCPDGAPGTPGQAGDSGPDTAAPGPKGPSGDTGEPGTSGPASPSTAKGASGDNGPKGDKGDKGSRGHRGSAGGPGTPGPPAVHPGSCCSGYNTYDCCGRRKRRDVGGGEHLQTPADFHVVCAAKGDHRTCFVYVAQCDHAENAKRICSERLGSSLATVDSADGLWHPAQRKAIMIAANMARLQKQINKVQNSLVCDPQVVWMEENSNAVLVEIQSPNATANAKPHVTPREATVAPFVCSYEEI